MPQFNGDNYPTVLPRPDDLVLLCQVSDGSTKTATVDSLASGIVPKEAVKVATTGNITLAGLQTIDGIALGSDDRVLVKNQATTSQNGIYTAATGAWPRATDADTAEELLANSYYFVRLGNTLGATGWYIQTPPTDLGTDPIVFALFSAATGYNAGPGINISGTTISVNPTQSLQALSVVGTISGSVDGNAGTATKLATARNINGVSFDGTSDITVPASASTLTGTTLPANIVNSSLNNYSAGTFGSMALQNSSAVNISGGTLNGASVTGLAAPSASSDAANKAYVDSISTGITPRTGVAVATTANITLSGEQTIDGILTSASRVLVKNQTLTQNNGIYVSAAGAWSRAADSDTAGELLFGYYYFVSGGTANAATSWFIQTPPVVLGTDPVVFSQFSASQSYSAGTGLTLTGNTFSLNSAIAMLRANNLSDVASVASARTNLGVTATGVDTTYMYRANNLSDLASAATARTNLGVGTGNTPQFTGMVASSASTGATSINIVNSSSGGHTYTLSSLGSGAGSPVPGSFILADGTAGWNPIVIDPSTGGMTVRGLASTGAVSATNNYSVSSTGANDAFVAFNNSGGGFGGFTWNLRAYAATGKMSIKGSSDWLTVDYSTGATTFTTLAPSSNANLRTTKGNLNLVVNVKDYGALGDGSTNDTAAIASAMAAAQSAHGVCYFPPGVYMTDAISISTALYLTICGEGIGSTIIKARSPGRVLNVVFSSHVSVHNITFDGSCTVRTAGGQAVVFDAVESSFCHNEIINSGEYAFFAGASSTPIYALNVSNNLIRACYADGINFQYVSNSIIANNIVEGSDDDCIALGYNGYGNTVDVLVIGNFCKPRNDLGTVWGRGILAENATTCHIIGNIVVGTKQTGIFVNGAGGSRAAGIQVKDNLVLGCATVSGHSIAAYMTSSCVIEGNTVENAASGNCMDIADWQNLVIKGGVLRQSLNQFCRGIHAAEESSASWISSTWTGLEISDVSVQMLGGATNSCVYLNPHSSITMASGIVSGIRSAQVAAGDYITIGTARASGTWKLGNNITMTASRTVNPSSTTGSITVFNNN